MSKQIDFFVPLDQEWQDNVEDEVIDPDAFSELDEFDIDRYYDWLMGK